MKFIATEEKARWMPREAQEGMPEACDLELTGEKAQTIRGFGGCFNELGQIALEKLDEGKRDEVLDALFGSEGCGFTVCRVPIGASDYAATRRRRTMSLGTFPSSGIRSICCPISTTRRSAGRS